MVDGIDFEWAFHYKDDSWACICMGCAKRYNAGMKHLQPVPADSYTLCDVRNCGNLADYYYVWGREK